MLSRVTLLGQIAFRDPNRRPMPFHHLTHHNRTLRRRSLMYDRLGGMEDLKVSVAAFGAYARLVRGDDAGAE